MSRHRAAACAPSSDWIEGVLGKRHRLSEFYDLAATRADQSDLLWMFSKAGDVEDAAYRADAQRNLATSAASHVLREVFAEFDSYVLSLTEQRTIEHRPLRSDDSLHSDVFLESHDRENNSDSFGVKIVFTDWIGALVFTTFATYAGHLDARSADVDDTAASDMKDPPSDGMHGLAVSETSRSVS
ncbi:hypothetical protein BJD99_11860 [Rhodococcus sp. 1163]|uniref:hypothetical protein n=1 Tax=Rhodococcus sp. 1163 TaxID=1905289 RepID=UPI000A059829|nr:hypothetical protein [Rhodococcus sp. 1163]ORI13823.1 hypothetical protein BJD99_11860 [Rhodococcus sp. 1163]